MPYADSPDVVLLPLLQRLEEMLSVIQKRLPPPVWEGQDMARAGLAVWRGMPEGLLHLPQNTGLPVGPLHDKQGHYPPLRDSMLAFGRRRPFNHVLLWGARGMGKSTMMRAAAAEMLAAVPERTTVVEILQEGLATLPRLLAAMLRHPEHRFLLLLDDLAYEDGASPQGYNALKSLLEGSMLIRPGQVMVVATSNRRHLVAELALEQESGRALHARESVEEKISLSDRFGLWLGFPACSQEEFLRMVDLHARAQGRDATERLHAEALEWAMTRGSRSGRVAAQFVRALAAQA